MLLPRSDVGIDRLAVPDLRPVEYGDGSGLSLRISPAGRSGLGGAKVWRWRVQLDGKLINVTLGHWSKDGAEGLTLSEARQRLDELKQAHKAGRLREELDKEKERQAAPATSEIEERLLVKNVAEDFRKFLVARRKKPEEVSRYLDKIIIPAFGHRSIQAVTTKDVRQLVEAEVARGVTTQAGHVLALVKQLFRFAQGRDDVQSNPADPLVAENLGVVHRESDRYLTGEEIRAVWHALDASTATPTVRAALRLLLLLAVRTGELLRATWAEVDLDAAIWTIPVAHQKLTRKQEKTAQPWVVPLPPQALAIFRELEVFARSIGSGFVAASFASGGAPLTDKSLNHAMRRLFEGKPPLLTFPGERPTPHDLRRTVRTHLGDTLGVEFHIAERCLNHSLGKIARIYDRGDYLQQRRAALGRWDAYVERLIAGPAAAVGRKHSARSGKQ